MKKRFQDLNLKDAFLFAAALEDPETCQIILELVLGFPVKNIVVHGEHSLLFSSDFRSIRLDIYASDETYVEYNLEMQNDDADDLAKRSRFHQAEMDVTSLKPGQDFRDLRPNYVVFICTFDPFGYELYRYTFENRCREADLELGDETKKIFLSTCGTNSHEVPVELVNFLKYVEDSTDSCIQSLQDENLNRIHANISRLKKSRRWEERYMQFGELLKKAEDRSFKEGEKKGETRMTDLIRAMAAAGDTEQIPRLADDVSFLTAMYEKYHL